MQGKGASNSFTENKNDTLKETKFSQDYVERSSSLRSEKWVKFGWNWFNREQRTQKVLGRVALS